MKPRPSSFVFALVLSAVAGSGAGSGVRAQPVCVGDCGGNDAVTIDELVTQVNVFLDRLPLGSCPQGGGAVSLDDLLFGVSNALAGCGSPGNRAPQASDVSLSADTITPYAQKQLIGTDPDNDTITYELIADDTGTGYDFAYVNPDSGVLYVTIASGFQGTIVLAYHVTDGKRFSNPANATIEVQTDTAARNTGNKDIDPKEYAGLPRGFYDGTLLGAPGEAPTLPSSVDLSKDFPRPGDQGRQSSCVGWALGYAIKTYQERVEIGWSLEAPEHRFSPAYIYNQINGGVDNGSVYRDGLDLVVNQGVATLARMPYDVGNFLQQPSDAARQEASQFRARSWKSANGTLEIKDALANHLGVFLAIQVFEDLQRLKGPDSVYNTFGGAFKGGHAIAAVGYDDQRYGGAFRIINSWSQNWGDGGYFWLPYSAANQIVNTPTRQTPVLLAAVVLEDMQNPMEPPPDPVDPPPAPLLPDLQVTDWGATYDEMPGGSGELQYTVTNTGVATAPPGAYVALLLSRDPTFTAGNVLVVYEPIPFSLPPGHTAYRDENNAIAFNFPDNVEPGEYYMAVWVDIWNDVAESREDDNISPADTTVEIVNTLPDLEVLSWYSVWDVFGNGLLTYDVLNNGASTAPAGWLIALALSPDDFIGNGDEIFLFAETANFAIDPGGTLYRDDSSPASFSLYYDYFGNPVPTGVYYLALWVDPVDSLTESNEINNASLSWGTVGISGLSGARSAARDLGAGASLDAASMTPGEAYNGRILPAGSVSTRKVRISATPQGGRRLELAEGEAGESGPRLKAAEPRRGSKVARARQQVIFPATTARPMPKAE